MTLQTPQDEYLVDLVAGVEPQHPIRHAVESSYSGHQRVSVTGMLGSGPHTLASVLKQVDENNAAGVRTICIIENISPQFIGSLGIAWNICKQFFVDHASNPTGPSLWEATMDQEPRDRADQLSKAFMGRSDPTVLRSIDQCFHIEGVFEHLKPEQKNGHNRFRRYYQYDPHYGWQANTKISYCHVSSDLYLFIVDTPFHNAAADSEHLLPARLSMLVPYSWHWRGLAIPQLYDQDDFSAFDCLEKYFSRRGAHQLAFAHHGQNAINPVIFAYFLSSSLWLDNIRYLHSDVSRIAFKDIRKPTVAMNNRLHNRRQDLTLLRTEVQSSSTWIKPKLNTELEALRDKWAPSPKQAFEMTLSEAAELERFLMDTFQLLMSSISVLDSQTSIKNAERSSHLTALATIYIPLSVVTGIFGMNIKEINGSPLSLWVVVVTLLVFILFTAWLLLATERWRAWMAALKGSVTSGADDKHASSA